MQKVMSLPLCGKPWLILPPLQHRHIAIAENRLPEEFVLKIVDRDELDFMNIYRPPRSYRMLEITLFHSGTLLILVMVKVLLPCQNMTYPSPRCEPRNVTVSSGR
jgi:hypothetical protein